MALIYLAVNDYEQTNFPKALEEVNRALALQREILPEGHIDFARSKTILGNILTRTGELARAEEHLRNALALRVKALKPGHTATAGTQGALGENLLEQNRFEEAEPLLLESHSALHKAFSATDSRTQKARARLATLYDAWGKPEAAANTADAARSAARTVMPERDGQLRRVAQRIAGRWRNTPPHWGQRTRNVSVAAGSPETSIRDRACLRWDLYQACAAALL